MNRNLEIYFMENILFLKGIDTGRVATWPGKVGNFDKIKIKIRFCQFKFTKFRIFQSLQMVKKILKILLSQNLIWYKLVEYP